MANIKGKSMAILIAAILTVSMGASMAVLPAASAHNPPLKIQLLAFLNVAPNPIGVGQTVTVDMWLNEPPPTASGPYGDRWQNFKVTVTLPDGTTQTLGPFTSDDTGGTHTEFTPSVVGNYTFQMSFPGQTLAGNNPAPLFYPGQPPNAFIGDYYEPANSSIVTLTVQQQSISTAYPSAPLPTNYWSRPINAMNNDWYSIAGNWLGLGQILFGNTGMYNASGNYNPYTTAPTTAHIIWTKPIAFGGTVGGEIGGSETGNYYSTRQYERMVCPIVIQGILYYTEYPETSADPAGWAAVNLQTGQTVWTTNSPLTDAGSCTILRCGQVLDFVTPNQYGSFAYLWSTGTPAGINAKPGTTTYNMFSATTGDYILSIVNGTSMTLTEDGSGDLIGYYVSGGMLYEWNSTQCVVVGTNGLAAWEWRPTQNAQIPFSDGIMWSAPVPTSYSGNALPASLGITYVDSGMIVMTALSSTGGSLFQSGWQIEAGFSATDGSQLWITNRTETPFTRLYVQSGTLSTVGDGVYVEENLNTFAITGYSMATGKQLWTNTLPDPNPYDADLVNGMVANGTLYMAGFGGDVYAINILNGDILWHYSTGSAGYDTPYGVWPIWDQGLASFTIGGGLLFVGEGHEYSPPLFRGANQLAINTTNGHAVWNILAFDVNDGAALSDGILEETNAYDNQIYAYGMGPSVTTVNAPDVGITTATPVTITGTVMDISVGSQQQAVAANFPHGLPCVSDDSMSQFMEAVYEQQPMPNNVTGVPVTISVTDSNGNCYDIGTTTSNANGFYSLTWTPTIPGNFTVTATFAGTQAYYGSSANAAFYASSVPSSTTVPATVTGNYATTTDFMIGVAVIIVVVIVCVAAAILLLRKRP